MVMATRQQHQAQGRIAPKSGRRPPNNTAVSEILRWQLLGVATFDGSVGRKGTYTSGWPRLRHEESWVVARRAVLRGPINLVVRTGPTSDGTRCLTAIDLDGRCPCGDDRDSHSDRRGPCCDCGCAQYAGIDPDDALAALLDLLPEGVAVNHTARGYHIVFWTAAEIPTGTLLEYGADIFGNAGHLLQVPPSQHPSGWTYRWAREPGPDLPLVDLIALGLTPKAAQVGESKRTTSARRDGSPNAASPAVQAEFAALMARAGVRRDRGGNEHLLCPWHGERAGSLHVNWEAATFYCFGDGCRVAGGLRHLRQLVGGPEAGQDALPPTCNPKGEGEISQGSQLGGWPDRREAAVRLAAVLAAAGEGSRAAKIRECATTFVWDPARATEWEAFVCPNGDSAPLRPVRPRSCDDHLCPVCMPQRLDADWNHRAVVVPDGLRFTIVRLEMRRGSEGLRDRSYLGRARAALREYRRAHGLTVGFYGVTLERADNGWRAVFWLALPDTAAASLTDGRAVTVTVLQHGATSQDVLRRWQAAYLAEATAWQDAEELLALRSVTRGRRKFQGFGEHFGCDEITSTSGTEETDAATAIRRVAGGSDAAVQTAPCCPRCGARLHTIGRFDRQTMETIVAPDGIAEWRWRARANSNP